MKRVGLWIAGAAVGCFAAGMNVGLVAPGLIEACNEPRATFDAEYLARLVADYKLTPKQERSIRFVLERCREEEQTPRLEVDMALLPLQVQKEILDARGRADQRIRAVLDAEQRARYDNDSRPK